MRWRSEIGRLSGHRAEAAGGFTLVELLVVLAIMGLALIVVPQVTAGFSRFQLHAASAKLADTLRQLRDDAIRTGQPTLLLLDADHARYEATGIPGWQPLPAIVDAARLSRDTPMRDDAENTLHFLGDGSTNGGVITLRHGARTEAITIDWLTGRVRSE